MESLAFFLPLFIYILLTSKGWEAASVLSQRGLAWLCVLTGEVPQHQQCGVNSRGVRGPWRAAQVLAFTDGDRGTLWGQSHSSAWHRCADTKVR